MDANAASKPRVRNSLESETIAPPAQKRLSPQQTRMFLAGELIGQEVAVEWSSCKELVGLRGRIVDETQNTFLLHTADGEKRIPKKACAFYFPQSSARAPGRLLAVRPQERTKRLLERR